MENTLMATGKLINTEERKCREIIKIINVRDTILLGQNYWYGIVIYSECQMKEYPKKS